MKKGTSVNNRELGEIWEQKKKASTRESMVASLFIKRERKKKKIRPHKQFKILWHQKQKLSWTPSFIGYKK